MHIQKVFFAVIIFCQRCQVAARTIANALRDICKKILIERSLAQVFANAHMLMLLVILQKIGHCSYRGGCNPTNAQKSTNFLLLIPNVR